MVPERKVMETVRLQSMIGAEIIVELLQLFYTEVNTLKRQHFKGIKLNKDGSYEGEVLEGMLTIQAEVHSLCFRSEGLDNVKPQEIDRVFKEVYGPMFGFENVAEKK